MDIIAQPNENRVIELPNAEQIKKGLFKISGGKIRRKYASALEKYFAYGSIDDEQYRAGQRLYEDAYNGGVLSNLKAIDYSKMRTSTKEDMSWYVDDKRKKFSNAMFSKEIGRVQREILWHVVIFDEDIIKFDKNRHYAIGLLRETLNELVRHYKR